MRLTIAYSKIKKRNLVLINNATYRRETISARPIRQPLKIYVFALLLFSVASASEKQKHVIAPIFVPNIRKGLSAHIRTFSLILKTNCQTVKWAM